MTLSCGKRIWSPGFGRKLLITDNSNGRLRLRLVIKAVGRYDRRSLPQEQGSILKSALYSLFLSCLLFVQLLEVVVEVFLTWMDMTY